MNITHPIPNETAPRPEFIRLPYRGPDPVFGLTRSYYYELERSGKLQMKRLRKPGNTRGIVLIPVAAVSAIIWGAKDEATHEAKGD